MTQAPDALAVPQWQPTERDIADARVTDFTRFVQQRTGASITDYKSLWQWSIDDPAAFWGALWEYFELGAPPDRVLDNAQMPGARWFPGVRLNYVDQIVRNARSDRPAILHVSEDGQVTELSWRRSHRRCGRTG
jgi:acetoacetyl-CoA synthetase